MPAPLDTHCKHDLIIMFMEICIPQEHLQAPSSSAGAKRKRNSHATNMGSGSEIRIPRSTSYKLKKNLEENLSVMRDLLEGIKQERNMVCFSIECQNCVRITH
jgi:hypothetical protein